MVSEEFSIAFRCFVFSGVPTVMGKVSASVDACLATSGHRSSSRRMFGILVGGIGLAACAGGVIVAMTDHPTAVTIDLIATSFTLLAAATLMAGLRLSDHGAWRIMAGFALVTALLAGLLMSERPHVALSLLAACVATAAALWPRPKPHLTRTPDDDGDEMTETKQPDAIIVDSRSVCSHLPEGAMTGLVVGARLAERVHLHDQLTLLSALGKVASGESQSLSLSLRINDAEVGSNASYNVCEMQLSHREDGRVAVVLMQTEPRQAVENRKILAVVSHELRTPLGAIIGYSQLLQMPEMASDPERCATYGHMIQTAGEDLLDLVNTILDVSKIEAGAFEINPEPFDIRGLVSSSVELMRGHADAKALTVTVRIAQGIDTFNADKTAIRRILINLLSNAIKFTPSQGCVGLEVDHAPDTGRLRIAVTDTGIGMAPELLAAVGTPFSRADNSYSRSTEGTGLGLALVKGLVELHNGDLSVNSRPDLGTAVTITLPVGAPLKRLVPTGLAATDAQARRIA